MSLGRLKYLYVYVLGDHPLGVYLVLQEHQICNLGTMVVRVRVRVHKFDAYNTHTGPLMANGEAVAEASKAT